MPRDDILRSIEKRLKALQDAISKSGTAAGAARGWETREGAAPVQYVPVPRRQAAPAPEALNVPRRRPVVPQGGASGATPPAVRDQLRQALAEVAARVTGKPQAQAPVQSSAPAPAQAPAPAAAPTKPILDPQKFREAVMALAARTAQKPKPQAAQQAPIAAPAAQPAPAQAPIRAPAPAPAPRPVQAPSPKPAKPLSFGDKKKLEEALTQAQARTAAGQPAQTEATPEMQRRAAQMQAAGHGGELSLEAVIEDLLGRKKKELKALFERVGDFSTVWNEIVLAFRNQIAKISAIEEAEARREHSHGITEGMPVNPPRPPRIPLPKQMRVNPRKIETPNVRTIKPPRLDNYVDNKQ